MDQAEYMISTIYNFRTALKMKELGGTKDHVRANQCFLGGLLSMSSAWLTCRGFSTILTWMAFILDLNEHLGQPQKISNNDIIQSVRGHLPIPRK